MKTMNASDFKTRCLAVLDDVARTGEPVVILKRGRPVARLVSGGGADEAFPQDGLFGSVEILGDVMEPVLPVAAWEAVSGSRSFLPGRK